MAELDVGQLLDWKHNQEQWIQACEPVMIQTVDGLSFDSLDGHDRFIEYVVQKALGKMPIPEEIQNLVRIDYRTSILYGESELAEDEARLEQARAQAAEAKLQQAEAEQAVFDANLEMHTSELEAKARMAGSMIGVKYGEPFYSARPLRVSDPFKVAPREFT